MGGQSEASTATQNRPGVCGGTGAPRCAPSCRPPRIAQEYAGAQAGAQAEAEAGCLVGLLVGREGVLELLQVDEAPCDLVLVQVLILIQW